METIFFKKKKKKLREFYKLFENFFQAVKPHLSIFIFLEIKASTGGRTELKLGSPWRFQFSIRCQGKGKLALYRINRKSNCEPLKNHVNFFKKRIEIHFYPFFWKKIIWSCWRSIHDDWGWNIEMKWNKALSQALSAST